jgi:hypothetical protein
VGDWTSKKKEKNENDKTPRGRESVSGTTSSRETREAENLLNETV